MKSKLTAAVVAYCMAASVAVTAQEPDDSRPVISTYAVEVGGERVADTYLSPLWYDGARVALSGEWQKRLPANPRHLAMRFDASVESAFTRNPARNARMYDLGVTFGWGLTYQWHPAPGWSVGAGGALGLEAGVLYLPRNGNNPAQARAGVNLSAVARASWSTRIGDVPVVISDHMSLPSAGVFFKPEYGEPYYEIWMGNRKGLVHAGWWGNDFGLDNLLSARFVLGRRALEVGYRLQVDSQHTNSLTYRRTAHSVVIGVTVGACGSRLAKETAL